MSQEPTVNDDPRPIKRRSAIRGPGDLVFAVAAVAFAVLIVMLLVRADLDDVHRGAFAVAALLLFVAHAARWRQSATLAPPDSASRLGRLTEAASIALVVVMAVSLVVLGDIYPQGAALCLLALVASAGYLSSWE